MRERQQLYRDIDGQLEDAPRARYQLDAERWREELRPHAMRLFPARTAKLHWSHALLKLVVEELYPDNPLEELVGDLDCVPLRRCPQVVAIAVALRHSWRGHGLTMIAKRLHVSLSTQAPNEVTQEEQHRPSLGRFSGSPRASQGFSASLQPRSGLTALTGSRSSLATALT